MARKRIPTAIRAVISIYLALSAGALTLALLDPGDDALSSVFLVVLSLPWIFALDLLHQTVGEDVHWMNITLACVGVALNTSLLYLLGRLVRRKRRWRTGNHPSNGG